LFLGGSSALPIKILQAISPTSLYLPYHHLVSNKKVPHIDHLYPYKNENQFIKDLDYLLKNFSPIEVEEVLNCLNENRPFPKNSFLITFDDGLKEIHDVVAPILEKKGVHAVFFLNTAYIDNKRLFYRFKISLLIDELLKNSNSPNYSKIYNDALQCGTKQIETIINKLKNIQQTDENILDKIASGIGFSFENYLDTIQPFLTTPQIESLITKGFSIGGHSVNHPYYPSLTLGEQIKETVDCLHSLSENYNLKNKLFAFPHSDKEIPQSFFDKINLDDVELFFGIQNQKREIKNRVLQRFNAERPGVSLQKQIKSVMVYNWMMERLGRNIVSRIP
ncbi:MAG: polysaccharide deacetylase family protein, partial [Ferruginibacter sp.]